MRGFIKGKREKTNTRKQRHQDKKQVGSGKGVVGSYFRIVQYKISLSSNIESFGGGGGFARPDR